MVIPTPTAQKESTFQLILPGGYNHYQGTRSELWYTRGTLGSCISDSNSHCIRKRMFLSVGNYKNYPQLWIIVVGSSGTGKSDAGRVAFRRISEIDRRCTHDIRNIRNGKRENKKPPHWQQMLINDTTPEAMFNALSYARMDLLLTEMN